MPVSDSQRAIVDWLTASPAPVHLGQDVGKSQKSDGTGRRRLPVADSDSVRFVRTRAFDNGELHAVLFVSGQRLWNLVLWSAPLEEGGYRVAPVGGGSGGAPQRERPWVNITAQLGPYFRAGGEVIGVDSTRARTVCLTFANSTKLEDTVESGWVLFQTEAPIVCPAEIAVFDEAGHVLASYAELEEFAP